MIFEVPQPSPAAASRAPLAGLRVIEFTHMVMGPAVGAILVELGAEVIRVEPIGGDSTRHLTGSGAGYFPMYNRNKKSLCLDLKTPEGLHIAQRLCAGADVVVENFRNGAMDRLGLGYDTLAVDNPRLIYCSEKGFLSGPYEDRAALDEVTQMMGGLAYMTGPPGRPLRAGTSVIDVTGGMFGVIAILAAIEQRHASGLGQKVSSALFETTVYLVGQHMAQMAVTGQPAKPMPVRISAWAIYDLFETADGEQVFVGIVSDGLWQKFCEAFGWTAEATDPAYKTNPQRVAQRAALLPRVRELGMFDEVYLRTEIENVRALGYAARNTGLLEGMAGVAVPVCGRDGRAVAALSVGTITGRLGPERLPTVVELLKREAQTIGPKINPFDPTLRRPVQSLAALLPN